MKPEEAVQMLADVLRRKHLALGAERSYCGWLVRYCGFIKHFPVDWPGEQKLERFLTALAKRDVSASTQNQAFNAILFFTMGCLHAEALSVLSPLDAG